MRAVLLPLVVLTAIGVWLVAGSVGLVSVPSEPRGSLGTAPELAAPDITTAPAEEPDGATRQTEYCGATRLAVVRRVQLGETEALADILPPSRWEAWLDIVRACDAAYGPPTLATPL